uniref:Uncharacterized protein n=1 Tax=Klebsiella pneumoniae TaxID=573 RepID=A0A8B0SUQ8_KLEPN|nr:hypothetical protein [Klebsiella pneumoniae]
MHLSIPAFPGMPATCKEKKVLSLKVLHLLKIFPLKKIRPYIMPAYIISNPCGWLVRHGICTDNVHTLIIYKGRSDKVDNVLLFFSITVTWVTSFLQK